MTFLRTPLKRNRTSAVAVGLRASLPLKMTSSIRSPRRLFALCSPITQVMASATLLLPQPLGPTMAVTSLVEGQFGAVGKRFETVDFETLETHEHTLRPADAGRHVPLCRSALHSGGGPYQDRQLVLAGMQNDTDRLAAFSLSACRKAAPGRKAVVSVTRPRYSGKSKLRHNSLWSCAQSCSCPSGPSSVRSRAPTRSA